MGIEVGIEVGTEVRTEVELKSEVKSEVNNSDFSQEHHYTPNSIRKIANAHSGTLLTPVRESEKGRKETSAHD